jgi:hypothetical protein
MSEEYRVTAREAVGREWAMLGSNRRPLPCEGDNF